MTIGTRVGKTLRWMFINGLMMFLVYYSITGQAPYQLWAERAFTFYVFLFGIIGWIHVFLPKDKLAETYKSWEPTVPQWLDQTYDTFMILAMASQGWWWSAVMYIGIGMNAGQLYKIYEARKENNETV